MALKRACPLGRISLGVKNFKIIYGFQVVVLDPIFIDYTCCEVSCLRVEHLVLLKSTKVHCCWIHLWDKSLVISCELYVAL